MPPTAQPAAAPNVTRNRPLPPTIENAYHRKCIDLKRRINEVEASNDTARLRKSRIERSIAKLRLERAFLLEKLAERMEYNVDDSDDSVSPPPTLSKPRDKPLRHKRARKSSPGPAAAANAPNSPPNNNTPYSIQTFSATPAASAPAAAGNATSAPVNGTPSRLAATPNDDSNALRSDNAGQEDEDDSAGGSTQQTAQARQENGTSAEHSQHKEESAGAEGATEAESGGAALENGEPEDVEMAEGGAGFTAVNR